MGRERNPIPRRKALWDGVNGEDPGYLSGWVVNPHTEFIFLIDDDAWDLQFLRGFLVVLDFGGQW